MKCRALVASSFLLLLIASSSTQVVAEPAPGVKVTPDANCIVAIDGHVVGRVDAGKEVFFRVSTGKHTLSAATVAGDYWDQELVFDKRTVLFTAIPLQKAGSERLVLEATNAALETHNQQMKEKLASIEQQNTVLARNPELIRAERGMIAQAIDHYAGRYGKELGLHDSRDAASNQLFQAAFVQSLGPTNNASATAELLEEAFALFEMHKAHRNHVVALAAAGRMHELEEALKDPLKNPRVPEQPDYFVKVRQVFSGKTPGRFITGPGQVEYRDEGRTVKLSCSDVRGVSGGKKLALTFSTPKGNGSKKKRKHTLHLRARDKHERKLLKTDVYLACDKFSQ